MISMVFVPYVSCCSVVMLYCIVTINNTGQLEKAGGWRRASQAHQGKSPCQKDKTDAFRLQHWTGLHAHHAQERHHHLELHCDDPGQVHEVFEIKRPEIVEGDWFFHCDNVPIHTDAVVKI